MLSGRPRLSVIVYARQKAIGRLIRARRPLLKLRIANAQAHRFHPCMDELAAGLESIGLLSKARRIDLAGAFVVEVNKDQLARLIELPVVRFVRPNRELKRRATSA